MDPIALLEEHHLDKTRQIKYWTRCLKSLLPHYYTGNDSNRLYLAFFIISALDLLDAWRTVASEDEKTEYINWIYHCQHPKGGFRMWPGTDFGDRANESNATWDPANVPATYFALSSLLIVGDDFQRVKRKETLQWLRRMQREDGSFGETLVNGHIEGGRDPRFGYCATGVRHILRGDSEGPVRMDGEDVQDIDIDGLVRCINLAESFDGGIADEPFHEPHAGYTYCALGALRFMNRLRTATPSTTLPIGPTDPQRTLAWLVSRQTDFIDPDLGPEGEFISATSQSQSHPPEDDISHDLDPNPADTLHQSPDKSTLVSPFAQHIFDAGMNGRPNKVADTCYAWWVGASAYMLGHPLYDQAALRRYLLGQTQHPALGGFGKFPGDVPDLYHSYLALATLGLTGSRDVKQVDAGMCVSVEASARIPALWRQFRK